jgi:hypothetical protein
LSADEPAVEPGREHAAIRRATLASKLALARIGNSNFIYANEHCCRVPQNIKDTFIRPNENKMSYRYRERTSIEVKVN